MGGWVPGTDGAAQEAVACSVNTVNDILVALAPDSGAYQNEASLRFLFWFV